MSRHLLMIERLNTNNVSFPGYLVSSTAPLNVEDRQEFTVEKRPDDVILEIADYLKKHEGNAEILILIHGYNTDKSGADWWYRTACEYIAQNFDQHIGSGFVVIGFRWPSEKIFQDVPGGFAVKATNIWKFVRSLSKSFRALPLPLAIAGKIGLAIAVIGMMINFLLAAFNLANSLVLVASSTIILFISLLIVFAILTVFVLRVSGYFRDTYRAANYGVSDLVEFIRQLDNKLVEQLEKENPLFDLAFWKQKNSDRRIRLNFVGHSMGAYVVTNTVRILSDVFDRNSIGSLEIDQQKKTPSSDIGNVFRLGRLVLVAPDIPSETLISGRGNPLRSSLRRFDEAYVFSNEGDAVLKLASTAANYFSFPTSTRDGGYRLGNVVVRSPDQRAGIVNLDSNGQLLPLSSSEFLNRLSIREGLPLSTRQQRIGWESDRFIAELFTYFDCTDYKERNKGIVSRALRKPFMNLLDYMAQTLAGIDGHGGLIYNSDAEWSRQLIYGLSCLGFEKALGLLDASETDKLALLKAFSDKCETKGMQILLAVERYQVDVLGKREARDRTGY
jgi:esterase/lipase superfamily enzyme